jgi:hypothetical protein
MDARKLPGWPLYVVLQSAKNPMHFRRPVSALFFACLMISNPAHALDLNPLSAIKGAVEHLVDDGTSKDAARDVKIKATIAAEVVDKMASQIISISSGVYEQRVMLTGIVETAEQKAKAGELAKGIDGIRKLVTHIEVRPKS